MKENEREYLRKLKSKTLLFGGVFVGGFILLPIAIFAGAITERGIFGGLLIISVISLFVCGILFGKNQKKYRSYFKQIFVTRLIKDIMPDAEYYPERGFSSELISKTGLMMMGNRYGSEDYVKGVYNGVAFERADMYIADESTDSEGHTTTTTYLQGRWMIFETNKDFSADLQVIQKGFGYAKKKKGLFTRKAERRHVFQTEDEAFNKQFTCLCQDETEAFYLLTPGMMQSLMKLTSEAPGKVMVGFVENRIHVAVHTGKDSLEPSIFKQLDYEKERRAVAAEMNAITSFISALNLDRRIFQ